LPQEAAKAERTEGLERSLDKFGEDWAISDCQAWWPSCISSSGSPVTAECWEHSGDTGKGPWAVLRASATGRRWRQDAGLDRPLL